MCRRGDGGNPRCLRWFTRAEVFKPALLEGSSAVVLSHNHPSGNPDPSREDLLVTDTLTEAGKLLGINVLDHIIHGDGTGEVISIRENG